ncbi:MAG: hypothetical protein WCG06_03700, partial [Candidatus Omnitrophota bacterium]
MKKILKENAYFIIFFGGLTLIFLWPLILLRKTFIYGDYWEQYYPWMQYYAKCLQEGRLPYWTDLIANGFPLVAEGQTAAYYLLHLIAYRILPFFEAYTWLIPLHIVLGGVGVYIYGQRIGLRKEGSALAAVIFSFASSYGGCFYTTAALRTLTWLPYLMIAQLKLSQEKGKRLFLWICLAGFFISQMWTGGFPQLAAYAMVYLLILVFFQTSRLRTLWATAASAITGFVLASPQIFATWELTRVSTRISQDASFALWGSVSPPAFIALVYPQWGALLRLSFYIGLVPLALLCLGAFLKKTRVIKAHWILVGIFVLLALGKYNPVYSWAVQTFSLT